MKRVLLFAFCLCIPSLALATPYISPEEAQKIQEADHHAVFAPGSFTAMASYDPLTRFGMCADFITTLQVSDTTSGSYGGMREGEHLLGIIQTDNTSESIWIWSHYFALTGSDIYHDNIDAAWHYCMNYPAYNEEGESDLITGYYRVYNCAWALRAEMEYQQVYGDTQYSGYADSCASYLCHNPLMLHFPTGFYRKVNGLVMGWAVGNLYEYGEFVDNATYRAKAIDMADSLKAWVEQNPNKLHWDQWAMNGGSVMWGLVHSYFKEYPAELETWVETYAPYLDTEIDSSDYQNAWRAWAALGQSTASEVLGSSLYAAYFKHLADTLVANDGDSDGGIPVKDADPDNYDQSWVTNYLGLMCMDRLLVTAGIGDVASEQDLNVRIIKNPSRGLPRISFTLNEPSPVRFAFYDIRGRRLVGSDLGWLGAGEQQIDLSDFISKYRIAPGMYFYELHSGRRLAKGKVVVLMFAR